MSEMNFPRPSHALKNILVLPGCWLAATLSAHPIRLEELLPMAPRILGVLLACCLVAAWNYLINDHCDQEGDRWHPEKSHRVGHDAGSARLLRLSVLGVTLLAAAALLLWLTDAGVHAASVLGLFVLSGVVYNLPPIRLKRFPFVDVVVEAINFPIRLALGWYAVLPDGALPPLSAMLAIWAFGGVLLTGKRAAELARIGDPDLARSYRPALLHYTREHAIVLSSLYGMVMLFASGVLFAVYRPLHNLIFLLPAVLALMGVYLWKLADGGLATRELEPEKLLRRRTVWSTGLILGILVIVLTAWRVDLTEWLGFYSGLRQ